MGEERIIPAPPRPRRRENEILDEVPNAAGLVLWQDVRHVRAWAESTPEVRGALFTPPSRNVLEKRHDARAAVGELSQAFTVLGDLPKQPLAVDAKVIAAACEEIVIWASERQHTSTAIEWAEVAALVDPENPRRANIAGRLTRNANEYDRAELWFKIGIGYAREQGNIVEQVWGHLGYGRLCQELGWVEGARKHLGRGSYLARKDGPSSLAASAQHDLAAMLMVRGHLKEATERAERALSWYPKNHPRLPYFAADVGLMLVLARRFAAAARVAKTALHSIKQPSDRAVVLALIARAYAGMGEQEEFAVHRRRSLKLLVKHAQLEAVARWHFADAHRLIGNWSEAESEAEQTLAIAISRNDRETARLTRLLLRAIADRRTEQPKGSKTGGLRQFLDYLIQRLAEWSPRPGRNYPGPWGENRAA